MTLLKATVVVDRKRNESLKQFYIMSGNGERNMLIETKDEDEARDWIFCIEEHAIYAAMLYRI
jgi:hypothetical protein